MMARGNSHCPVLIVEDDEDLREMMAQLLTLVRSHCRPS